jgi:hypothetical protein
LTPFVDSSCRLSSSVQAIVLGKTVRIPKRIHFVGLDTDKLQTQGQYRPSIQCLCTRSTDGCMRQFSLRRILRIEESWVIPYVVLLSGEYVVEIIEGHGRRAFDAKPRCVCELRSREPSFNAWFEVEGDQLLGPLLSSFISQSKHFPGLAFLHQLELWATQSEL